MLHVEAIEPDTLELLKQLQCDPALVGIRLVGGTSLALQLGHRKSVDLDLFGSFGVMGSELERALQRYGGVELVNRSKVVETYFVRGIKVDIVNYPYVWLTEPLQTDGVRLAAVYDIAPMKLEAITNRGSKKDFIDLAFLLQTYTLREMLGWYTAKYPRGSEYLVLRSLVYFDDAEDDPMPVMLKSLSWDEAKERICDAVRATA